MCRPLSAQRTSHVLKPYTLATGSCQKTLTLQKEWSPAVSSSSVLPPMSSGVMGDKVAAIAEMKAAGVPCVPGSDGPLGADIEAQPPAGQ